MRTINEFKSSKTVSQFVLEKFEDERIPFTAGIELTAKCNFNCIHCYASPNRNKKDLTNKQVKDIIDTLVENGTIEIFFTGGDCLIRKDFKDIYIYAKRKGMLVSVLTNATLLTEDLAKTFCDYPISELSITMYGYTKETYESITKCPGSFEKFHEALNLIKKYNLPCQFKVVCMKPNLHECIDMIDFGRSMGFKVSYSFDIRPMIDLDNSPVSLRVTPEQVCWFDYNETEQIELINNVAKNYPREEDEIDVRRKEGYLFLCQIAKQFVFINCEGKMQGCVKYSIEQYDLINGSFNEGWNIMGKIRNRIASDNFLCASCENFDYCEQCTANNILENGNAELPVDFYCKCADKKAKHILEIRKQIGLI